MRKGPILTALVVALALTVTRTSRAQSHAGDVAAAQTLFDDARALVKAGRYSEACPKFEESERLDAGPGTEFNLADCYQRAGRTASAWAQFVAVADSLKAAGQRDRAKVARDRAAALEPRLTKLAVNVPPAARAKGLEIRRDAEILREAQWGIGVAVDPGHHTLSASAPGMTPWQTTADALAEGTTVTVDVPRLEAIRSAPVAPIAAAPPPAAAEPAAAPPAPVGDEGAHPGSGRRIAAIVVGAVGVVGIGVGSYFGVEALSKHSDYVPHCPNNVCDPTGLQLHSDAASAATTSTIAMAAGLAALAGGAILWLTAPSSTSTSSASGGLRVTPAIAATGGGLSVEGAW